MIRLLKILIQTVIIPFYKTNVSFFFLIFVVLVATVHPPELIFTFPFLTSIATSPFFLFIYFVIVILYTRKSYRFFLMSIRKPQNCFFYYLPLLNPLKFNVLFGASMLLLLFPVLVYGFLIGISGLYIQQWASLLSIILFYIVTSVVLVFLLYQIVSKQPNEYKSNIRISSFGATKFYFDFYINFLLNEKKVFYLLTKAGSLSLLYGVISLFHTETYPLQFIYIGVLIGVIFNNLLIYELNKFEDQFLGIIRNIPIRSTVYVVNAVTFLIIMLPELVLLGVRLSNSTEIINLTVFTLSLCLTISTNAYLSGGGMKRFLKLTFTLFIIVFIALLFKVPILLITTICFVFSFFLFYLNYFKIDNRAFSGKTDHVR